MSEVVSVTVEVERYDGTGKVVYDRYENTQGYGHFLGQVVIYDLDGEPMTAYQQYESIASWDVTDE